MAMIMMMAKNTLMIDSDKDNANDNDNENDNYNDNYNVIILLSFFVYLIVIVMY